MADRAFYEKFRTTPQGQALLRMIRYAEGTERGGPDSYRVMFGGSLAPNLKQHPDKVITGGGYSSSAAGAYQFLTPTWQQQQKKLGLQSFGPVEQDIAALDLARQRTVGLGGLSYLQEKGLTPEFVAKLAPEWASLPTQQGKSYYGQPVKSYDELKKVYGQQAATPVATTSTQQPQATQATTQAPEQTTPRYNVKDLMKASFAFQNLLNLINQQSPTERLIQDFMSGNPLRMFK
jgi:muramidase (phage lysozyme)